jgi:hypothetical protein
MWIWQGLIYSLYFSLFNPQIKEYIPNNLFCKSNYSLICIINNKNNAFVWI